MSDPWADFIEDPVKKLSTGADVAISSLSGLAQGGSQFLGSGGDLLELLKTGVQSGASAAEKRGLAPKGMGEIMGQALRSKPPGMGVSDAARLGVAAAVRGVTGDAGKAKAAANLVPSATRLPTSRDIGDAVAGKKGVQYHDPQTTAGEYARTLAQFAPAAVMPGSVATRAANVVVPALTSETAGQLTEGSPIEPYARIAGALAGAGGVALASQPRPPTRMLAESARGATDEQVMMAQALRQDAAQRGVTLTQAEAVQQVTGGSTGLGRLQRVLEGTQSGSERIIPVMSQRPDQVRGAVTQFADNIAPPTANPSMIGAQAQQAATGSLDDVRQAINAQAKPFYDRLPGQSLPDDAYQQLAANPSYQAAMRDVRGNAELAPLLRGDMPMDDAARMLRAQQQGFDTAKTYYHGSADDIRDFSVEMSRGGNYGPGVYTSRRPDIASSYAGQNGAVYPVFLKGKRLDLTTPEGRSAYSAMSADEIASQYDLIRAPGESVALNNASIRSRFDQFAPPNPDNDLNVINRIVQRLDEMKDAVTPSAVNPQGSNTLAAQRGSARSLADTLASEASPDWRMARETVAQGRATQLEPLQRGPLGAVASTDAVPAQTNALFPPRPLEGAPAETQRAIELLMQQNPTVPPALIRQHVMNNMNEATQNLQGGANQWGGAKFAAQIAGNPEQRRTLTAGIDAAAPGQGPEFERLTQILEATGKRQAPGSMTAYNMEDLKKLGETGLVGQVASTGLNPPGFFRKMGDAFYRFNVERNAAQLTDALLANPEQATQILMEARRTVPAGAQLQQIEQLALTAMQGRQGERSLPAVVP